MHGTRIYFGRAGHALIMALSSVCLLMLSDTEKAKQEDKTSLVGCVSPWLLETWSFSSSIATVLQNRLAFFYCAS